MKVLLAGASGAIGWPLIDLLVAEGHEVYGLTQSKEKAGMLAGKGAKPIMADVRDAAAISMHMLAARPDVVIDMLTRLPADYTPEAMQQAAALDASTRLEGGANLQAAAEEAGVKRYIAQSSAFWYAAGDAWAEENTPFACDAPPGVAASINVYEQIEQRVLQSEKIEGVILRFGFFYGPGTWFQPKASVARQIEVRSLPIVGQGKGVWNFVHIEDAALAARSALYATPGTYNIVNDYPTPMREWLPAFARYLDAPLPPYISEEEGLQRKGADFVYYATRLRGASNAKAKRDFSFEPRSFEWFV